MPKDIVDLAGSVRRVHADLMTTFSGLVQPSADGVVPAFPGENLLLLVITYIPTSYCSGLKWYADQGARRDGYLPSTGPTFA